MADSDSHIEAKENSRRMMDKGKVYVSFIELSMNPNWEEINRFSWGDNLDTKVFGFYLSPDSWSLYRATRGAEVEVIEPEATRRWMAFKTGAIIAIGSQMMRYDDKDFDHELVYPT